MSAQPQLQRGSKFRHKSLGLHAARYLQIANTVYAVMAWQMLEAEKTPEGCLPLGNVIQDALAQSEPLSQEEFGAIYFYAGSLYDRLGDENTVLRLRLFGREVMDELERPVSFETFMHAAVIRLEDDAYAEELQQKGMQEEVAVL